MEVLGFRVWVPAFGVYGLESRVKSPGFGFRV